MINSSIYIFAGPIRSGKTSRLLQWSKQQKVTGLLTPDGVDGRVLLQIETGIQFPFEVSSNTNALHQVIGRFHFLTSAFTLGQQWIESGLGRADWMVIDEVGKLELLQQKGFEPAIQHAIDFYRQSNAKGKLLLVVRDSLLQQAIDHYRLSNHVTIITDLSVID